MSSPTLSASGINKQIASTNGVPPPSQYIYIYTGLSANDSIIYFEKGAKAGKSFNGG